jgi:adenylate cyclase
LLGSGGRGGALQRDEHNVRARINLAFKFIDRILTVQSLDREADIRRADELVSKALAIDPNAYVAHFAKAEVLLAQKRFEEAIIEAERSLALNPSLSAPTVACALPAASWGDREKPLSMLTKRCA